MTDRLYEFYNLNIEKINRIFSLYDSNAEVTAVKAIHSGMSTSNFEVDTVKKKYLLKIYSNPCENAEIAMYRYLSGIIDIPEIYCYDDSKINCAYDCVIMEYIDGKTLTEFITAQKGYNLNYIFRIGQMLSLIHQKKYPSNGILDRALMIKKCFSSTYDQIISLTCGKAGSHLSADKKKELLWFTEHNKILFEQIETENVLCHNDFGYGNILISDKIYFIDFEYSLAGSKYRDIGHFFRNKSPDIQRHFNISVCEAFAGGYNSTSKLLPDNWLLLSRITDIPAMMGLINRDDAPRQWVSDIESDIISIIK